LAPDYKPPAVAIPAAYKENTDMGPWRPATPSDAAPRLDWWRAYRDPTLDALETRIDTSNPSLAASVARYDQARAYAAATSASFLPFVGLDASADRDRQSADRPLRSRDQPNQYGANTIDLDVNYDLDFWGRIRNTVAAGEAAAEASAADTEVVRLGLHAELANDYLSLRGLDAELSLLTDTVDAYSRAATLTENRFLGKIASGIDVSRAQSQLDSARALMSDVKAARALREHAIASLVGAPASSFSLPSAVVDIPVPEIPLSMPSMLLQRRPDIAGAERQVAAANAGIGIARAAFYPDISLSLMGGFQDTASVAGLIKAPYSFWSVGPQLAMPLFEGGLLEARERQAYATFDQMSSQYRATVLAAFQEVEDNLALLNHLGQESRDESAAVKAAERTADLSLNLYKNGAVSYLDVVIAQTDALQAERALLDLNMRRLQASVRLIRALGGGWSAADLPDAAEAELARAR
jgi:NodT family efflux transporter outer membrane factor (OMF) lipoprotein